MVVIVLVVGFTTTGGGGPGAPPPLLKLETNVIFWRKIVIFHTKNPTNFRAFLRSTQFF
jgi:hypothetical protein